MFNFIYHFSVHLLCIRVMLDVARTLDDEHQSQTPFDSDSRGQYRSGTATRVHKLSSQPHSPHRPILALTCHGQDNYVNISLAQFYYYGGGSEFRAVITSEF